MQPGDRPLLQTTVRRETIGGRTAWITVIKIGHYTTIELTVPQLMTLTDNLAEIRAAWLKHEISARDAIKCDPR